MSLNCFMHAAREMFWFCFVFLFQVFMFYRGMCGLSLPCSANKIWLNCFLRCHHLFKWQLFCFVCCLHPGYQMTVHLTMLQDSLLASEILVTIKDCVICIICKDYASIALSISWGLASVDKGEVIITIHKCFICSL